MNWDWLHWKPRSVNLSWSWEFSGPDAGNDLCMRCGVKRRFHDGQDHVFVEKGDTQ